MPKMPTMVLRKGMMGSCHHGSLVFLLNLEKSEMLTARVLKPAVTDVCCGQ